MNRAARKRIGEETVAVLQRKQYHSPTGVVSLAASIEEMIKNTKFIPEEEEIKVPVNGNTYETVLEVTGETSLEACKRLSELYQDDKPIACLNFASAHNPGGGFLSGSLAQEESLAAHSALYASQTSPTGNLLYQSNGRLPRSQPSRPHTIYKSDMLWSPRVPVFREEPSGTFMSKPYHVSFISAPAPNAGATYQNFKNKCPAEKLTEMIDAALTTRITRVLSLCLQENHRVVVLGAYGCGVFRNDVQKVSHIFASVIKKDFHNSFERIVFPVCDPSLKGKTYFAFKEAFPNA